MKKLSFAPFILKDQNIVQNYLSRSQSKQITDLMNPDYTSDLRQVERFHFDHSIYLLEMFDRKIDNFKNSKCAPQVVSRSSYAFKVDETNKNVSYRGEATRYLQRDSTKPIWNCRTKVDCRSVYQQENPLETIKLISRINSLFERFFKKYKDEHEDESNFFINLRPFNMEKEILTQLYFSEMSESPVEDNEFQKPIVQLFRMLTESCQIDLQRLDSAEDSKRSSSDSQIVRKTLEASKQFFLNYTSEFLRDEDMRKLQAELGSFVKAMHQNFTDVVNCKAGCLAICLLPKLMTLPLLIHPALLAVHSFIKEQMIENAKKEEGKNVNKYGKQEGHGKYCFNEIRSESLSKVVFINLDGYESQFNIDIAKYLSKYVMYISFPNESVSNKEAYFKDAEEEKSAHYLRKYFYGKLCEREKEYLLSKFKISEKEQKKNLHIYPICSREFNSLYNLDGIDFFEANFIRFMMKEVIESQIRDFNPSCVIVSYSQKLNIEEDVFVDIIKELTVYANYKVIFYANLSKNYMQEEAIPEKMTDSKELMKIESQLSYLNEPSVNIFDEEGNISEDIFSKLAIAMKICSGTFNLNQTPEQESLIQKYKNYKTMEYAGPMLSALSSEYSHLSKIKLRLVDYTTLSRVLSNHFSNKETYAKMFKSLAKTYHDCLMREVENILCMDLTKEEHELMDIRKMIDEKYSIERKSKIMNYFMFEYQLAICSEKVEAKKIFHLQPFHKTQPLSSKTGNPICLEFQMHMEKDIHFGEFASYSKFYLESSRPYSNALIYLTNYLPKMKNPRFMNFYGIITPDFDDKVEPRVSMYPVTFAGPNLNHFETYTEFNYFETQDYVFMFWPKVYDSRLELLCKILGKKYTPRPTKLIFCAHRSRPDRFLSLQVENPDDYKLIIPRNGCKCYQVPGTNTIYIMGGFYSGDNNYLKFQTDLTQFRYESNTEDSPPRIMMTNVSKKFYFEYQEKREEPGFNVITKINNDLIRAKVEYEVLEEVRVEGSLEQNIFLIGGTGDKFVRPCSIVSHMATKIKFDARNGQLISVKRIPTNCLIPINVKGSVKVRNSMEMKIVSNAQNRNFYLSEGSTGSKAEVISYRNVTYNPEEQKFKYETEYEFADVDRKAYRDDTISLLKKPASQLEAPTSKAQITAKTTRTQNYNNNFLIISNNKNIKSLQTLQLELQSLKVTNVYPDMGKCVRLPGESIVSIDVKNNFVYGIICHPMYTLNQCILAEIDLSKFSQNGDQDVSFQHIHTFDEDVRHNIMIAANVHEILVLHGHVFDSEAKISEYLIKKTKKSPIRPMPIKKVHHPKMMQIMKECEIAGIASSLFLYNQGLVHCFSFKTLTRSKEEEKILLIVDQLDLVELPLGWKSYSEVILNVGIQSAKKDLFRKRDCLKILEIVEHTNKDYELIFSYDEACYHGILRLGQTEGTCLEMGMILQPMEKSVEKYYEDLCHKGSNEKANSILLDKSFLQYQEFKREDSEMNEEV